MSFDNKHQHTIGTTRFMKLNLLKSGTFKFYYFLLFTLRWIPRSPRWLIANNHLEEAHDVLMKYAMYNHVTVDSKHLKHVIQEVRKSDARKSAGKKYGILDTLKTPKLRKRTLILIFNW